METITVGLEDRSYPIYIGTSLDCGSLIRDALPKVKDLMVVTNETVGPLYFDALKVQLEKASFNVKVCVLKDGESYKTVDSWWQILTALMECQFGRDGAIVALGGGVVGDIEVRRSHIRGNLLPVGNLAAQSVGRANTHPEGIVRSQVVVFNLDTSKLIVVALNVASAECNTVVLIGFDREGVVLLSCECVDSCEGYNSHHGCACCEDLLFHSSFLSAIDSQEIFQCIMFLHFPAASNNATAANAHERQTSTPSICST